MKYIVNTKSVDIFEYVIEAKDEWEARDMVTEFACNGDIGKKVDEYWDIVDVNQKGGDV